MPQRTELFVAHGVHEARRTTRTPSVIRSADFGFACICGHSCRGVTKTTAPATFAAGAEIHNSLDQLFNAACAAASRATGTRNGEQLT